MPGGIVAALRPISDHHQMSKATLSQVSQSETRIGPKVEFCPFKVSRIFCLLNYFKIAAQN